MSSPPPENGLVVDNDADATDPDIRERMVSQYQLSAEAVEKIFDVMERSGTSFADAALYLGFIRKQEIPRNEVHGEVLSARVGSVRPGGGLIETAINRISARRDVVLRQGSEVTPGPQLQAAFDKANPRNEKMRALRTE